LALIESPSGAPEKVQKSGCAFQKWSQLGFQTKRGVEQPGSSSGS
jgi:hypothetical protein